MQPAKEMLFSFASKSPISFGTVAEAEQMPTKDLKEEIHGCVEAQTGLHRDHNQDVPKYNHQVDEQKQEKAGLLDLLVLGLA